MELRPERWSSDFSDARDVPTVRDWRFAVTLTPGLHTIRVQLVTTAHHAFNPPAQAAVTLTVSTQAPPVEARPC